MPRTLVTGGYGYLGFRIVRRLREIGHTVTILSRSPVETSAEKDWIHCDLADRLATEKSLRGREFDFVIHAAATQETSQIKSSNVEGTRNLWDSLSPKPGRAVFLSTVHVYGPPENKITELTKVQPVTLYAESKRQGELITLDSIENATILRVSNAYGCPAKTEGAEWRLLTNDLIRSALRDKELHLHSDPHDARDFVWIENVVDAITEIATPGIFNCSAGSTRTLGSIAEAVQKAGEKKLGREIRIRCDTADPETPPPFSIYPEKLLSTIPLKIEDHLESEISRTFDFLIGTSQ
ncbi:MAG: NAD-dependent epimerase/dehydratase family protein [Verrucomicrobiota bacterium]